MNLSAVIKTLALLIGLAPVGAQTVLHHDSINVEPGQATFHLSRFPVLDSTFCLTNEGMLIDSYQLDPLSGTVTLPQPPSRRSTYQAVYQILPLPLVVEMDFPPLESFTAGHQPTPRLTPAPLLRPEEHLSSSGSAFRTLELSPAGGTDLSGGLNMQLQGRLGHGIQVHGLLSDQSFNLQPQGNTRTLDETDRLYLQVTHPQVEVVGGDIEVKHNSGKFLDINRKLIGIKNNFKLSGWEGSVLYGSLKGHYRRLKFKGLEGNQGPYLLTSQDGNREVVIVAGTETVWVDGRRLERGSNYDYVIDYSGAEITFTPRILIHGDTDIYVEYQYADFQYNRSLVGTSLARVAGNRSRVELSWIRESDQSSPGSLGDTQARLLTRTGDGEATLASAALDSSGDYVILEGVYRHDPGRTYPAESRYQVSFSPDLEGDYVRRVSSRGALYYEYRAPGDHPAGLARFSPSRRIVKPVRQDLLQLAGQWSPGEYLEAQAEVAFSDLDRNRLSSRDDHDNLGRAFHLRLGGQEIHLPGGVLWSYRIINWGRERTFQALQRHREVDFERRWNLPSDVSGGEWLRSLGTTFSLLELGHTSLTWSQYYQGQTRNRLEGDLRAQTTYIPELEASLNWVAGESNFYQSAAYAALLPGRFHPFLAYAGEADPGRSKYDHFSTGFKWATETASTSLGIGKRLDWAELDTSRAGLEAASSGYFGQFDHNWRGGRGWSHELVLRKRIVSAVPQGDEVDFDLVHLQLIYRNPAHPLRWDLKARLEESLVETRATVYDSVGTGRGSFRYDGQFNEYIADRDGAYLAYSILTGNRQPATRFSVLQRLEVDLSAWRRLTALAWRTELRADFQGRNFSLPALAHSGLETSEVSQARWMIRSELDYHPVRTRRRVRQWLLLRRDLNGLDPRGGDLRREREAGLEWREPLGPGLAGIMTLNLARVGVRSAFSPRRDRRSAGYWLEGGLKWTPERAWQVDLILVGARDRGQHSGGNFRAGARGVRFQVLRFIGTRGRIQVQLEKDFVRTSPGGRLPPENLKGLAPGTTLKAQLQGQIILGNNLTLNLNGHYISDQRRAQLAALRGELRAHF